MRDPRPINERWHLAHQLHCEQALTYAEVGRCMGISTARARQLDGQFEGAVRDIPVYEHIAAAQAKDAIELAALSMRTRNTLRRAGLRTEEQVRPLTDAQLLAIRNFGRHMLAEVRCVLHEVKR